MATTTNNNTASTTGQIKSFDNLRTLLRSAKSAAGNDLYQHLVDVMNHIVIHCPDEGLEKFEEISFLLKNKNRLDINEFLKVTEDKTYNRHDEEIKEMTHKFLHKAKQFYEVTF